MKIGVIAPIALMLATAGLVAQENPIPRTTSLTVQGFKFEITKCEKLSTKNITCYFSITNQQADRWLKLRSDHSYFVDAGGMKIDGVSGHLGSSRHGWGGETDMVTDITVKGSVEFPVGDPKATSLAKLSLLFTTNNEFRVEFRKIPLEGS